MANWRSEIGLNLCVGVLWWALLGLAVWIYWPGLDGPALLDDSVNLSPLEIVKTEPKYWRDAIFGNASGPSGRPVAMASFVVGFVLDYGDVRSGKYVNLMLHLLNANVLFWLVYLLVKRIEPHAALYAMLASALWLLNPLLTSTVLYLIQRMASLCTLWIFVGLLIYVKARLTFALRDIRFVIAMLFWILCLIAAVFTKENGALLVPITLLVEVAVLQFRSPYDGDSKIFRRVIQVFSSIAFLIVIGWFILNVEPITASFAFRGFTLGERLLTESRIVWSSVGQYFSPLSTGFGVYHDDIEVSKNLLHPLTTLLAVLGWLLIIAFACYAVVRKKMVFPALGGLVFLVGHSIESTVFPLELYFEHRNYLAGLGLTILFAGILVWLAKNVEINPALLASVAAGYIFSFVPSLARETEIWSDRLLLTMNSVNHHPESVRANLEWARILAERGQFDLALQYTGRAHAAESVPAERKKLLVSLHRMMMHCIANKSLDQTDAGSIAENWLHWHDYRSTMALESLINMGQEGICAKRSMLELSHLFWSIVEQFGFVLFDPRTLANLARMEGNLGNFKIAVNYAKAWVERSPENAKALLMMAYFAGNAGAEQDYQWALAALRGLDERKKLSLGDQDSYKSLIKLP